MNYKVLQEQIVVKKKAQEEEKAKVGAFVLYILNHFRKIGSGLLLEKKSRL